MRLLLLISLSLLLSSWQTAWAQLAPADDFFNSGAQFYISNNIPQALESTEAGLKQYPEDVKLKKLYELLKQQQQSQEQNSNSQQNQQSSQKNSQDQQKQAGQNKNEQEKQQEQQKASAQKQNGEKKESQNEQGQPVAAGQMTSEEARQLLDAQKGDEQFLQLKPQGKPQENHQPIKDW
jgi:Ca-activated chloride channel family protein